MDPMPRRVAIWLHARAGRHFDSCHSLTPSSAQSPAISRLTCADLIEESFRQIDVRSRGRARLSARSGTPYGLWARFTCSSVTLRRRNNMKIQSLRDVVARSRVRDGGPVRRFGVGRGGYMTHRMTAVA